ncbi:hypothetical protein N7532_001410 [Penicillium argentinense]|uniref:EKC/KEOPS complex subunit BUD32 n=1 Tax=Penicillium argentinense TaxID=1131581 RepID=A0A9W9G2F2_9EURO|nr:uncharacterized protein N7532_001410 [Penicillium argentinense]KAJ5110875.1 hypothetical protein N7532_001410 [Penicillium argentinense]
MNGYPVMLRPKGGSRIIEFGTTGIICQSGCNPSQVIKGPLKHNLDGCSADVIETTLYLEKHAELCIEREKTIYRALPKDPNILDCISITDSGIILPFMRLGNLRDYLRQHDRNIQMEMRMQWIHMAIEAISSIHRLEIIHADISARNFLVAENLSIKLCDFSGSAIGGQTPLVAEEERYQMAPDSPRSIATDIFALGCLIFEIVTGRRPYDNIEDQNVEEVQRRYAAAIYPCIDGIPFGEIINKCWTCQYQNIEQLKLDLPTARHKNRRTENTKGLLCLVTPTILFAIGVLAFRQLKPTQLCRS